MRHQLKELPEFEDVFSSMLEKVRKMCIEMHRETILTGEIGALLHDIGKLHPDFIKSKSVEETAPDIHAQIDKFLKPELIKFIKNSKFDITVGNEKSTIYNLITQHHRDEKKIDSIVRLLKRCDHKDSADDKGVVRKKQHLDNTWITSPFGYEKEKIDLLCLQKRFEDLENNLRGLFKDYISETISLPCFREFLMNTLKTSFSHALGETRIPSNDVTLWDHSYSTASLFKTLLAAKVCGANKKSQWRIFGICWDGLGFINKGRKIAEIKARNKMIENIKEELKRKFEDEIPIGNAIYNDTNGIYFTFPELEANSKSLARECAEEALEIIYRESDNELWPFFILSKASSTLTTIAEELKIASEKRKIPKISPTLFIEGKEVEAFENPKIATPSEGQDICPICRIRPKDEKAERCEICEDRRMGRLKQWLSNRQDTVWIDEVADKNNRIALISLSFNLDKWLDGTMIGTIYSQSFKDWYYGKKGGKGAKSNIEILSEIQDELKEKIKKQIESLEKAIKGMKNAKDRDTVKEKIIKKTEEKEELEQKIKWFTFILNPDKNTAYRVLDVFFDLKDHEKEYGKIKIDGKEFAARILDTFFEEDIGLNKNTLETHLSNIKERLGDKSLNKEKLATYLFTQNPSPARLYRVWKETEEFFDLLIGEIKDKIYSIKWKRIKFFVNYTHLKSKLKQGKRIEKSTPYIIQINNLEPPKFLVFHNENGEFYTIESLEKFKFNNKRGEEAVKEALKHGFKHLALEDEPDKNLLQLNYDEKIKPEENSIETEEYYPLIEINKSPLSLRLIVPASDSMKIIELVIKLYNDRFEKVLGKLPLNIKLLMAKRKFPLYILLDAEKRMFEGGEFKMQAPMNPWWNVDGFRNEQYYSFYPTKPIKEEKYTLDDLSSISKGKIFHLYPGYFDFELLLGTTDRYSIYYKGKNRGEKDYKLFTGRPYYFYQISEMLELWDILSENLSSSQINFIEEMLTSKLRKWRSVEDVNKKAVLGEFAGATLKDVFGNKWNGLKEETKIFLINSAINGLLLDTIILFRHKIKKMEVNENE